MSKLNQWLNNVRQALNIDVTNTGDTALQIAKLQYSITDLSSRHFSSHKHDHHSKRGLYQKIGNMKSLEKYLGSKDPARLKALYAAIGRVKKSAAS